MYDGLAGGGKTLREQREQGLLKRLGPLFKYFFLDGFASGCLGIPLSLYMSFRVLNENPQRMAMFALWSTLVYQVPRIPLAPIHGEVADRMPRKWLIYVSKMFDIGCNFLIATIPDMYYILGIYFLRALFNVHSACEQNYFLDLTMYIDPAREAEARRTSAAERHRRDPGDKLMSKAVVADEGIQNIQGGGIAGGFYSGTGSLFGQIVGGVLVRQKVLTIRAAIYIALGIKAVAQGAILLMPETRPAAPGDPAGCELLGAAVSEAWRLVDAGWEDQKARWRGGEPLLDDFTRFVAAVFYGGGVYGLLFGLAFQYRVKPTKQQRIDAALALIPCGMAGLMAWFYHYSSTRKGEILVAPKYLAAIFVALAGGAFASSYAGFGAAKESEIPNFKGSYLGRFPLVSADFWTSDHLSERSRSVDVFSITRARGILTLKRR